VNGYPTIHVNRYPIAASIPTTHSCWTHASVPDTDKTHQPGKELADGRPAAGPRFQRQRDLEGPRWSKLVRPATGRQRGTAAARSGEAGDRRPAAANAGERRRARRECGPTRASVESRRRRDLQRPQVCARDGRRGHAAEACGMDAEAPPRSRARRRGGGVTGGQRCGRHGLLAGV
jgi:hypothetical protein